MSSAVAWSKMEVADLATNTPQARPGASFEGSGTFFTAAAQAAQIADAEAAFASAGLKTPDAVEDCLVCWDFMTTFRAARGVR